MEIVTAQKTKSGDIFMQIKVNQKEYNKINSGLVNSSRSTISSDMIASAIEKVKDKLVENIQNKGAGTFTSIHEISGALTEEYYELLEAVHLNDYIKIEKELIDISSAAIFGIACLLDQSLDW